VEEESGPGDPRPALVEVRSADGTIIGYQRVGTGPAVVLLHGAGQSSANLTRLARALSAAFTVYVPDRRGRGRSGPYGEFRGLSTEIEDLSAVLDASGASRLFGLSSGAVVAIEAALVRPDIARLALYEPPLTFDGVVHGEWAPRYERQLNAGKPGAALVTVLKATADRPSLIRWIPRLPLAAALDFAIRRTASRPAPAATCPLANWSRPCATTLRRSTARPERWSDSARFPVRSSCWAAPGAPATSLPRSTAWAAFSRAHDEW
jgi:pimeloyl-ACP methyl ester carboxylesterase